MSVLAAVEAKKKKIVYPESDGLPMADNTKQFRWIVTIQGGLDALYRDDPQVFVAGNLLWYPAEGDSTICVAPDIFTVFGRPKGDRGSYLQWLEMNIAPQVVFEILSPGNRVAKLINKFKFYERHGVEEYYVYDPDDGTLDGWLRTQGELKEIPQMIGWTSPRLQVHFDLVDGDLQLYGPDGKKFATYVELVEQREAERQAKEQARAQAELARQQAQEARQQAQQAEQRAKQLEAQLRALGAEPKADD